MSLKFFILCFLFGIAVASIYHGLTQECATDAWFAGGLALGVFIAICAGEVQ